MKLTNGQMHFMFKCFFQNDRYTGWLSIAEDLIERRQSTVAGTECICVGGISNFIRLEPLDGTYQVSVYKFDIVVFMKSAWFNELRELYLSELDNDINSEYNAKLANRVDISIM